MRQLLDGGFQFPQQSVVRFNLPIQFTAVGDNALFLHMLSGGGIPGMEAAPGYPAEPADHDTEEMEDTENE